MFKKLISEQTLIFRYCITPLALQFFIVILLPPLAVVSVSDFSLEHSDVDNRWPFIKICDHLRSPSLHYAGAHNV